MRRTRRILGATLVIGGALPLGLLLVWSFSRRWYFPALLPQEFSLHAWTALLAPAGPVWPALKGSAWVGGMTALLATLIALPAARQLARERPLPRAVVGGLILAPLVLPTFAGVMGVQVALIRLGVADTPAGVIAAHLIPATPYATVLLTGTFEGYNARFEEVARTLGARRREVVTRVTLPLLLPGVLVAALLAFLVSWSEYLLTLIVGGGQVATLPALLFASAQGGDYALTAALSVVYVTPALLIFSLVAWKLRGWPA
ncbi:ABC transporter permease subunit (plasmid) [Deinococcus taeanensis]|uniref:ABC transporter permease n=1 Tax=Deinococcus taeanensis TaxID=2737050 RepID=UPI001CDBE933|nr:ABC transporter permease subunit [Deinococcus taeanensis]UBV44545.1 ABC transporter permease subunit [Deinococcus taeanensis]